jgi:hypothetical protein
MKHSLFGQTLLVTTLLATSAAAAVDPALLALAPPDTKAFVGIQVDQAQSSSLGQYLLSHMDSDSGLDKFATLTGFDPRHDLSQVLIATNGKQGPLGSAVIFGRGSFQPNKLSAAATLGGATRTTYSGIDLLTSKDANQTMQTLAFLDPTTVLVGDTASVRSAIDRYRTGTSFNGALAQRAGEVSGQYQAWFVASSVDELANNFGAGGGGLPANAMQSILTAAGGLKLTADAVTVALEAVTRTDKDAQSLVDVVKFLASMVQTNRGTDANSQRAATLVDTASITSNGPTMRVSMAIPEKDVEQMLATQPKANRNRTGKN